MYVLIFDKNGLGYILVYFFASSSGHSYSSGYKGRLKTELCSLFKTFRDLIREAQTKGNGKAFLTNNGTLSCPKHQTGPKEMGQLPSNT
jgi:hypothetical protein